jgi:nitrate/nitrite transporter NarK
VIAPEPWLVFSTRGLAGIGTGIGFVAGSEYVRATGGSAVAMGLYGGFVMGGAALTLAVVPQLELALGWRGPWAYAVASSLVAGAVLLGAPGAERAAPGRRFSPAAALEVLRDRRLARIVVLHVVTFGFGLLVGNWIVALLVRLDYSQSAAGVIGAVSFGATMVTRPIGGWILHRWPEAMRPTLGASLVAGALGCAGVTAGGPPVAAVACTLAIGVGTGMAFASVFTASAASRPDAPGAAVGVVNMWANLAIVVGTPLLGLGFSLPGDGRIGFLAVAALWALAALALPTRRELGVER